VRREKEGKGEKRNRKEGREKGVRNGKERKGTEGRSKIGERRTLSPPFIFSGYAYAYVTVITPLSTKYDHWVCHLSCMRVRQGKFGKQIDILESGRPKLTAIFDH